MSTRIYTTPADYAAAIVVPALGDKNVKYFDVDAIAADMTTLVNVIDPRTGMIHDNRSGFVERDDRDFWDVAESHAIRDQDDEDGDDLPDWGVGDIAEVPGGVAIVTPNGMWELTHAQARSLAMGLRAMTQQA